MNADNIETYNSLAFVAGTFINLLLDNDIPHNMILAGQGKTVYIFPRKDQKANTSTDMKSSWIELAGIAICLSEESFDKMKYDVYNQILKEEVKLEESKYESIKKEFTNIIKASFN